MQYWGQPFEANGLFRDGSVEMTIGSVYKSGCIRDGYYYGLNANNEDFPIEECSIKLKPLALISDEDALMVSEIVRGKNIPDEDKEEITRNKHHYTEEFCQRGARPVPTWPHGIIIAADYLRSRGYALPYGEYSVDQLVEAGIFNLI